jgi:hypothetical protein
VTYVEKDRARREIVPHWEGLGYRVEKSESVNKSDIEKHLGSFNIARYMYVGHGDAGNINTVPASESVAMDKYTSYGIASMVLIACESAKGGLPGHIEAGAYRFNQWEWNVSRVGVFLGYTFSFDRYQRQYFITSPGSDVPENMKPIRERSR